jgi:hypothetical protein
LTHSRPSEPIFLEKSQEEAQKGWKCKKDAIMLAGNEGNGREERKRRRRKGKKKA